MAELNTNERIEECLENRVVLNMILTNLTFSDLKNTRLVNKIFKTEANHVLSTRNNCILRIRAKQLCLELHHLYEILPFMTIPFIGLAISTDVTENESPCLNDHTFFAELDSNLPRLKYLELSWQGAEDCSTEFGVSLFKRNENFIEELVLNNPVELIKRIFSDAGMKLENLKVLRIKTGKLDLLRLGEGVQESSPLVHNLVYSALSSAPKLQEIRGVRFSSLTQVPRECFGAIREFNFYGPPTSREEENLFATYGVSGPPKLTHLHITFSDAFPRTGTLARIMGVNRESLKYVNVEMPSVSTLLDYLRNGMGPLEAVEKFHFVVSLADTTPEIRTKLARLISYVFPNLKEVAVIDGEFGRENYDELLREHFNDAAADPDLVINSGVIRLSFGDGQIPLFFLLQTSLPLLHEIFPNVIELRYTTLDFGCGLEFVPNIWTAWPKLSKLDIEGEVTDSADYDADICGIFHEEAEQLRKETVEYLQEVVIVPVRPAIYYLQDLKQLRIKDAHKQRNQELELEMFTEVAAFLAFKRMNAEIRITGDKSDKGLQRLADAGIIQFNQDYGPEVVDDEAYGYLPLR